MDRRSFVLGDVAVLAIDIRIEGRIARPRFQHAELEIHAVHFGSHELLIAELRYGPSR